MRRWLTEIREGGCFLAGVCSRSRDLAPLCVAALVCTLEFDDAAAGTGLRGAILVAFKVDLLCTRKDVVFVGGQELVVNLT
jgi:hypothetical protein